MMKGVLAVLGVAVVLLLAACGSSSGGGWQLVSQAQSSSTAPAIIDTAYVGRPADVEVKITGSPSVVVHTSYTFICGDFINGAANTEYVAPGRVPVTQPLIVPIGPPTDCRLNVAAFHGKPANLTISLYARSIST